jgi:fibronectin type 3 domain-containing protein
MLLAALTLVVAALAVTRLLPPPPLARPDLILDRLFTAYGNQGGHWTGGDRTASVALPDGRTVWLFSDTYLGPVGRDGSRPATAPLIHNSMVVESHGRLGLTLTGGRPAAPRSLVSGPDPAVLYWVADGVVAGNQLRVLYNQLRVVGNIGFDVQLTGTAMATFSLPDLTLTELRTLPLTAVTAWGSSILDDGGYTYIYGSASGGDATAPKFAKLARVPLGGLGAPWQFWTGTTWSPRESDAARLLSGVGTAYSVTHDGDRYLLVTVDSNVGFSRSILAYTASSPTGPFGPPTLLLDAPEAAAPNRIVYDASVHPEQGRPGALVVSYNVNTLDPADNLANVSIYRPRFVDITWPLPAYAGRGPVAPSGLTATVDLGGTVHLGWTSAASGASYRVYQRDVSLGQSYLARLPFAVSGTSASAAFLRNGDRYEFAVATIAHTGQEGPPSRPVSVIVAMTRPPPPTGLAATPDPSGGIVVRWAPSPYPVTYTLYQRDLTAKQATAQRLDLIGSGAAARTDPLSQDHTYEFTVTAHNGAGESGSSDPASATAHAQPPLAPQSLRAVVSADGGVRLSWQPAASRQSSGLSRAIEPAGPVLYVVYQEDLTAGEQSYTRWAFPTAALQVEADALHSGHTYLLTVAARGLGGDGPTAPPVKVSVSGGLPGMVAALTGSAGDGQVGLIWSPVGGPDSAYLIYRRDLTVGETTFTRLPLPVVGDRFTDRGVYNGHLYLYRVAAGNAHGEGAPSPAVLAQPLPPPPAAPTRLRASPGDHAVTLTWTAPGADHYYYFVYRRDLTRGEAFQRFPLPITTGTTFVDGFLVSGDTYQYEVTAANLAGEGPASDVTTVSAGAGGGNSSH